MVLECIKHYHLKWRRERSVFLPDKSPGLMSFNYQFRNMLVGIHTEHGDRNARVMGSITKKY